MEYILLLLLFTDINANVHINTNLLSLLLIIDLSYLSFIILLLSLLLLIFLNSCYIFIEFLEINAHYHLCSEIMDSNGCCLLFGRIEFPDKTAIIL